jgi:hypothetical protein
MGRILRALLNLLAFVLSGAGNVFGYVLGNALGLVVIIVMAVDAVLKVAVVLFVLWAILYLITLSN